jgi:hypothetical protein
LLPFGGLPDPDEWPCDVVLLMCNWRDEMRHRVRLERFALLVLTAAVPAIGASFTFETINVRGITGAQITDINNLGQMSGYGGAGQVLSGFVLGSGGVATVFQPGSSGTQTFGLNDAGQVVGKFDGMGGSHAYVGTPSLLNTIVVPDAASTPQANGINQSGDVVGIFSMGGVTHGFLDVAGVFTPVDFPGSTGTQAFGVNQAHDIVGSFSTGGATDRAFIDSGGVFTPINVPGSTGTTIAYGINDFGVIIGVFDTGTGNEGFLDSGGVITTMSVPGASQTMPFGINDSGQIVGDYIDSNGLSHAFLATPAAAVPEPATKCLMVIGLGTVAVLTRRRSRRFTGFTTTSLHGNG